MTRFGTLLCSVVAVVVVLALSACGENGQKGQEGSVRIANFQFTPQNLTVKPGARVTWTNGDSAVHSIKDTSPLATPVSRDLAKGDTFSLTYERPGAYTFICGIHQYMTGSVLVR